MTTFIRLQLSLLALAFLFLNTGCGKISDLKDELNPPAKNDPVDPSDESDSLVQTCPDGYLLIPGNPDFDTNDFCVMAYLARPFHVESEKTVEGANFGDQEDHLPYPTSENSAWTGATVETYSQLCTRLGENYHLMNHEEYMTILRNIEQIDSNWVDTDNPDTNEVGVGQLRGPDDDGSFQLESGDFIHDLLRGEYIEALLGDVIDQCGGRPSNGGQWNNQNECLQSHYGPSNPDWGADEGMGKTWSTNMRESAIRRGGSDGPYRWWSYDGDYFNNIMTNGFRCVFLP